VIKVCHIITDKNIGGAGRWLLYYLDFFDKAVFEIKVILPKGSLLSKYISKKNIQIIELEDMKESSFDFKTINKMKSIFLSEKFDIVHTHASISARIAAKAAGIKYVVNTKHCMESSGSNALKKHIKGFINKTFSDTIIAVSQAVKESMVLEGTDEGLIKVIYNGIVPLKKYDEYEKSKIRQKYEIKQNDICVTMLARLEPVKDHETFLRAAAVLARQHKNIKFIAAGAGSLEKQLKDLAKELGIEKNVIFSGFIENIEEIMNITDINVITSKQEALCLSIIEGMSIGVPAVGTDAGGIPEVIENGKTGYIAQVGDYEKIAEFIADLLEDEDTYNTFSENCIKAVEEKFLAKDMAEKIEELYLKGRKENEK